ncbi:hypothetical protein ACQJBY_012824 [Aegilops geniculata]
MAPASASLLPAASSNAGTKRPFAAEASDGTELPRALPQGQESAAGKKNGNGQSLQQQQQKLECPRCSSTDTKFCYYNNYSTAQPRHYCPTCRRYWTQGGTLRKVPVGGACRRGSGSSSKRRRSSAAGRRRGVAATGRSPPPACGTTLSASSSPGHHRHRPGTDQCLLSSQPRSRLIVLVCNFTWEIVRLL